MRLSSIALLAAVCVATPALADDPPAAPTTEQLAAAKQAFEEGNALFKAGKLDEAVLKLKESYRLSRNAYLLYNIGHTYDQLGHKDLVLFYYRKFLVAAPANAPMREGVQKRVTALEAENVQAMTPEGETADNDSTTGTPQGPVSKYSAADFKHESIETAPPGWPIDITAAIPADSGFAVKLFYRASGDDSFISKPMTWRNYELVARIPGAKATGKVVQYYIEVRTAADKLVTRAGKSTSPNLIHIEPNAKKQYYEDYVDEGGEVIAPVPVDPVQFGSGETPHDDTPSGAIKIAKWVTSGVALGLFTTSIVSYKLAGDQHDKLVSDAAECGAPPCRAWDASFGERVQTLGQRYDTLYKVTLGAGIVTAGVATFLWIKDLRHTSRSTATTESSTAWLIAPAVGQHFAGATAGAVF